MYEFLLLIECFVAAYIIIIFTETNYIKHSFQDYAIETPLKKLSSDSEEDAFRKVKIEFKSDCGVAAINFVLKVFSLQQFAFVINASSLQMIMYFLVFAKVSIPTP